MEDRTGPNRGFECRGVRITLPDDMVTPTCTACGAEWVSGEWLHVVSKIEQDERRLMLAREMFPTRLKFQVDAFGKLLASIPEDCTPTPPTEGD